jgi:hypothetical protein
VECEGGNHAHTFWLCSEFPFARFSQRDVWLSGFIGYDTSSIMRGVEYIRLTGTAGTYVRTAMRLMALDAPLP